MSIACYSSHVEYWKMPLGCEIPTSQPSDTAAVEAQAVADETSTPARIPSAVRSAFVQHYSESVYLGHVEVRGSKIVSKTSLPCFNLGITERSTP
jgi:hypothetical protein